MFEKGLDANGPEFLVIGSGIGIEEVSFAGSHPFEDRSGNGREFRKMIVKGYIPAFPDRKIHVGERMSHLMEAYILSVWVIVVARFGLKKPALSSMPGPCPDLAAHDGKKEYGRQEGDHMPDREIHTFKIRQNAGF